MQLRCGWPTPSVIRHTPLSVAQRRLRSHPSSRHCPATESTVLLQLPPPPPPLSRAATPASPHALALPPPLLPLLLLLLRPLPPLARLSCTRQRPASASPDSRGDPGGPVTSAPSAVRSITRRSCSASRDRPFSTSSGTSATASASPPRLSRHQLTASTSLLRRSSALPCWRAGPPPPSTLRAIAFALSRHLAAKREKNSVAEQRRGNRRQHEMRRAPKDKGLRPEPNLGNCKTYLEHYTLQHIQSPTASIV